MRTRFELYQNDEFEDEFDLWIVTETFTLQTNHSIWRLDPDHPWKMSVDPDSHYMFNIELNLSIYKEVNKHDTIEASTRFELIKILENALRHYSHLFADGRNYDFNIHDNIWNKERSLQITNLTTYI